MRERQTAEVDARVVVGGRLGPAGDGYRGRMPGVLEETLLAIRAQRRVYLVGAFGGCGRLVVDALEGVSRKELQWDYQRAVPHSEEMRALYQNRGEAWDDYDPIAAESTYNNSASTLNMTLKAAKRWKVIRQVPHRFQLLKRQKSRPRFYDFDQYQWLVEAAEKIDPRIHLLVLIGGDAGLRRGEIIALEWTDVDLRRRLLTVERSEWKTKTTETKGMKYRVVPMTKRLFKALTAHRHLRGERVLYADEGKPVSAKVLQKWMARVQKRAGLRATGALHILRHTLCSRLAMRGAPALSIQRLAGHEDLQTTLGYMHLAQGETERAIRLLDSAPPVGADAGEAASNDPERKATAT